MFDWPDNRGNCSGNTTSAKVARTIYTNPEIHERITELLPLEYQSDFRKMIENDRILLGIMSSSRKVKIEKIRELSRDQLTIIERFGEKGFEIKIPPTVHELYAHLEEKIRANNGYGLKQYSEENLEALHKICRKYREELARKTSNEDNLRDVLRRLNFRSDPIIRAFEEKQKKCGFCYEVGHYKTTCDLRKSDKLAEYFVQDDHASEAGDENIEEGDEDYDSEEPDDDDGYEVYNEYLEDDTD